MMLKKHLLCGLVAVTTAMTTIALNAPSSYAAPGVNPAQAEETFFEGGNLYRWVIRNGRKVKELVTKNWDNIPKPKRPPSPNTIKRTEQFRREACKKNPDLFICNKVVDK